jgi:hypothetical protein
MPPSCTIQLRKIVRVLSGKYHSKIKYYARNKSKKMKFPADTLVNVACGSDMYIKFRVTLIQGICIVILEDSSEIVTVMIV